MHLRTLLHLQGAHSPAAGERHRRVSSPVRLLSERRFDQVRCLSQLCPRCGQSDQVSRGFGLQWGDLSVRLARSSWELQCWGLSGLQLPCTWACRWHCTRGGCQSWGWAALLSPPTDLQEILCLRQRTSSSLQLWQVPGLQCADKTLRLLQQGARVLCSAQGEAEAQGRAQCARPGGGTGLSIISLYLAQEAAELCNLLFPVNTCSSMRIVY